jgi:hypothetical protein
VPPDAPRGPGPAERRAGSDRRTGVDRRQKNVPVAHERRSGVDRRAIADRRASQRGGQYDLDGDTLEFIRAVNDFKEHTGKPFPSWSDILGILKALGYEKRA